MTRASGKRSAVTANLCVMWTELTGGCDHERYRSPKRAAAAGADPQENGPLTVSGAAQGLGGLDRQVDGQINQPPRLRMVPP